MYYAYFCGKLLLSERNGGMDYDRRFACGRADQKISGFYFREYQLFRSDRFHNGADRAEWFRKNNYDQADTESAEEAVRFDHGIGI